MAGARRNGSSQNRTDAKPGHSIKRRFVRFARLRHDSLDAKGRAQWEGPPRARIHGRVARDGDRVVDFATCSRFATGTRTCSVSTGFRTAEAGFPDRWADVNLYGQEPDHDAFHFFVDIPVKME